LFEGPFVFGHLRRRSASRDGPAHSSDGSFGSAIYHPLADSIASPALKAATVGRLSCMPTLTESGRCPRGTSLATDAALKGVSYRTIEAGLKANTTRLQAFFLHHRLGPVFQRFFHLVQELVRDGAIHHAMVVAQCYVAHRTDGDGIVDHYRALLNRSQA